MEPVFGDKPPDGEALVVSFLELIELAVVSGFRKQRVPLQRLRDAHAFARNSFDLPYPFASLNLREHGGHVLHEFEESTPGPGKLVVLDMHGQFVLPETVKLRVIDFDFDADRLASRWFPFGRTIPVVIDPHLAAGIPTVAGTRISVETLKRRWKSGEPINSIAVDLEVDQQDVERILQHAA
jgi:uncharacterized protein (DUF433 family)